jgi:mRNA interferase MazF
VRPARGEIWWHEPPDEKPRPYLILTRNEAIDRLTKLVAVPSTRTIRHLQSEVPLDREDGMPGSCVLSTDNITVVRKALLTRRITALSPEKMTEVCRALNAAVSC